MMRRAQPWLGTLIEISLPGTLPQPSLHAGFEAAFEVMAAVHHAMSFHAPGSDISRFNRAATGAVLRLSPHTATVLRAALEMQQASGGIFDIRLASRLAACAMLPSPEVPPVFEPGQQAYRFLDALCVEKLRNDWLDVGGIAKGYAVDAALAVLQQQGISDAVVNAGGDVRVMGQHRIQLRDPQQPWQAAGDILVSDQALATSAMYFSQQTVQGQAGSALFDGRSGVSLSSSHSYSVLADTCMVADALTKILAATGDAAHSCLARFQAKALIL